MWKQPEWAGDNKRSDRSSEHCHIRPPNRTCNPHTCTAVVHHQNGFFCTSHLPTRAREIARTFHCPVICPALLGLSILFPAQILLDTNLCKIQPFIATLLRPGRRPLFQDTAGTILKSKPLSPVKPEYVVTISGPEWRVHNIWVLTKPNQLRETNNGINIFWMSLAYLGYNVQLLVFTLAQNYLFEHNS